MYHQRSRPHQRPERIQLNNHVNRYLSDEPKLARTAFARAITTTGDDNENLAELMRAGHLGWSPFLEKMATRCAELGLISMDGTGETEKHSFTLDFDWDGKPAWFFCDTRTKYQTSPEIPNHPTDLSTETLSQMFKLASIVATEMERPFCRIAFHVGAWKTAKYFHSHWYFQDPINDVETLTVSEEECSTLITKSQAACSQFVQKEWAASCQKPPREKIKSYELPELPHANFPIPQTIVLTDQDDEGSSSMFTDYNRVFYPHSDVLSQCEFSVKWGSSRPCIVVSLLSTPEDVDGVIQDPYCLLLYELFSIARSFKDCSVNVIVPAIGTGQSSSDAQPLARGYVRVGEDEFVRRYPEGDDLNNFLGCINWMKANGLNF